MQIAQVLAGYSLGGADLLRRAMGKKKPEEMAKQKAELPRRREGQAASIRKIADQVFELMAFFAGYGFNRSHSAAYGWITYQTAYLKHHYPHEFMAGLMSCDADNVDNIVKFIAEARAMGLVVERPDINESLQDFTVTPRPARIGGKVIRFGLGAVKGVGATAVEAILEARASDGRFDVAVRAVPAGRHPEVQPARARAADQGRRARRPAGRPPPRAAARGARRRARARRRPSSAIGAAARPRCSGCSRAEPSRRAAPGAPSMGETLPRDRGVEPQAAARVREGGARLLRLGPSARSLPRRPRALRDARRRATSRPAQARVGEHAIGGIVSQYREMITKKGDKMARFMLEDAEGTLEVIAFPKTFEKVRHVLVSDEPILCTRRGQERGQRRGARVEDAARDRGAAVRAAPAEDVARRHPPQRRPADPRSDRRAQDDPRERDARQLPGGAAAQDPAALRDRDHAARRVGRRRRPRIC